MQDEQIFQDRGRMARLIAIVMLRSYSRELRLEISSKGFDEFCRVAKPQLGKFSLRQEDYQTVFDAIEASVRPGWSPQNLQS